MKIELLETRYQRIEAAMTELQRLSWRAIMPTEVHNLLNWDESEKCIRRDMDQMVALGRLVKVGHRQARGYRLATAAQKAAFAAKYAKRPLGHIEVSEYTELVYGAIEDAVSRAYRDLGRGVLPRDIQARLPYDRAEGSLRRDCLAMWAAGRLVRVSGVAARQGYRPPTRIEKLAFNLNQGMWPHGTEFVMSWA